MQSLQHFAQVALVALLPALTPAPHPPEQLWQTTATGATHDIYGMHFTNRHSGHAVGWGISTTDAVILATDDGGRSWTTLHSEPDAILFAVAFAGQRGLAVGQDSLKSKGLLLRTDDGGATWTRQLFGPSFGLYDVCFTSANTAYLCGWNGAIHKTLDGGDSWSKQNTPKGNEVFRSLSFLDDLNGFALGGTPFGGNRILATSNGGASWTQAKQFGSATTLSSLHFLTSNQGLAAGFKAGVEAVLRTVDGGATWATVSQNPNGGVLQAIDGRGRHAWAAGTGPDLHFTNDGGATWRLVPGPVGVTLLSVSAFGAGVIAAGSDGDVHVLDGHAIDLEDALGAAGWATRLGQLLNSPGSRGLRE